MSIELDFTNPQFLQNPHPFYEELRKTKKPFWVPQKKEMNSSSKGIWFFGNYNDALAIFKQSVLISNNILKVLPKSDTNAFFMHMLNSDGLEHKRLRGLVSQFFSHEYIKNIENHITKVVDDLIYELKKKDRVDLMNDFAEKVPFGVIANIIGMPSEDMSKVREWTIAIGNGFDTMLVNAEIIKIQQKAIVDILIYLRTLINSKDKIIKDTLLDSLVSSHKNGLLNEDELVGMLGFLLLAGHETTINLIGNGLWLLLTHREQLETLKRQPELISSAIEEILRFESPLQRSNFRIAEENLEINGIKIEKGEQISIIIASANRDEEVFPNADIFDIKRNPNPHIAFGAGVHNCIGKNLARVEAKIAFNKIIEHFPNIKLESEYPNWRKNTFLRGLKDLRVVL